MRRFLLLCSLPLIFAASQCPPQQNARFRCDDAAIFVLDVSSTMGTKENIQKLFTYFQTVILPQYNFKGYQPIQIMTYGANSTPIVETTDYEKTVCPGMERLLSEALDTGLQKVLFKDALKETYKTFGDEYDTPVIIFSAANNETEIDDAIDYRHKHLKDEYFTIVAVNSTFTTWKWFQAISTYAVPLEQLFDYKNLDMCILDASCADLETFCSVYPPSTTPKPLTSAPKISTTTVPVASTTSAATVPQVLQCQSEKCSCPNNTLAMKNDQNGRPVGGCYYASAVQSNYAIAQRKCVQLGGFLVMDKDGDQDQWLGQTYSSSLNMFWIGLVFDRSQQQYFWSDNSTLGSFQPWASTSKNPPPSGQDCVISVGHWFNSDCRNFASSICVLPPCDSRGYCTVPAQ